eukprot:TRINITY_DN3477_c0_g1_i2.p1 TRINITY_DN3477_c0_g1~~TRINITY_DN3477_c0_g1_i2.p1  ORF type:complete len:493 (+),score=112.96 TRINITY_DN3477_c0_g1_i2:537-2015(+)
MKRLLVGFERAVSKNSQMRIKYPGQPNKFVETEVDLDEEIKKLHAITSAPHLYEELISLKAHVTILGLLIHDNTDIVVDAVELIKELTDTDVTVENSNAVKLLVDSLLENQVLELLVSNLNRLNEKDVDERQGVYNILGIFENFLDVIPEICEQLGSKTDLLSWLLKRIHIREFDSVKQYCCEILSILLQSSRANQIKVGKMNGIDVLLTAVARYKKTSPSTTEEEEMVENLFNSLCTCCVLEESKSYFSRADGLKLLQIMIKNKSFVRRCALRLLDYVTLRDVANCRRWVSLPGLGTLFSAFMKSPKKKRVGFSEKEDEEHVISIICSLFRMLEFSEQGKLWMRVLNKFREENMQKVERLLELYEKYRQRVAKVVQRIEIEFKQRREEGEELDSEDEEEVYLRKLDAGLFTLQHICYVISVICATNTQIKDKVRQLLVFQDSSFEDVKEILMVYADGIGGGEIPKEETEKDQMHIKKLASELIESEVPIYH